MKLMKNIWRKGHILKYYQIAEDCFAPMEEISAEIRQSRTISLLNAEGKIFFAVVARRITLYVVDN